MLWGISSYLLSIAFDTKGAAVLEGLLRVQGDCWDRYRWLILFLSTAVAQTSGYAVAQDLPLLIRKHSEETRRAFREVSFAIEQNEKLANPIPDPYIARAEIWTIVGNYEGALDDYLMAVRLQSHCETNLAERARSLDTLSHALERLAEQPVTQFPLEAEEAFWLGVNEFRKQKMEAAKPFFRESVQLNPRDASHRAYLALTLRRLGEDSAAERQALNARAILRHPDTDPIEYRRFHRRLEGVIGAERQWLQQHIDSVARTPSSPSVSSGIQ